MGYSSSAPAGSEVIGRWEKVRIEGSQLLADAVFDMEDYRAKEIARKVDEGFLKAASIGLEVQSRSEAPEDKLPIQTGSTITKGVLLEASIVDIPQSEDALKQNYVQLSYAAAPAGNTNQITTQTTENMEELQELKAFQKSVGKELSLKRADEDSVTQAIEGLRTKASGAEAAKEQAEQALAAEYKAQDERELTLAVACGAISEAEKPNFEKLLTADRATTQALLHARVAQHEASQKQLATDKQKVANAVKGSGASTEKSPAELTEKQVKALQLQDPEGYASYVKELANEDTGLVSLD